MNRYSKISLAILLFLSYAKDVFAYFVTNGVEAKPDIFNFVANLVMWIACWIALLSIALGLFFFLRYAYFKLGQNKHTDEKIVQGMKQSMKLVKISILYSIAAAVLYYALDTLRIYF